MRNSFINKVTRVHKVLTVANSISLCSTILVVFLEFILVDRAEISHMNTPQNSSRLPGSYEEALGQLGQLAYYFQISSKRAIECHTSGRCM